MNRKGQGLLMIVPFVLMALLAICLLLKWSGFIPFTNDWKNRSYCEEHGMDYAGAGACWRVWESELASGATVIYKEIWEIPKKQ